MPEKNLKIFPPNGVDSVIYGVSFAYQIPEKESQTKGKKMRIATEQDFEGVTTAELIADIKKQLAERRAQFERDYPVEVDA